MKFYRWPEWKKLHSSDFFAFQIPDSGYFLVIQNTEEVITPKWLEVTCSQGDIPSIRYFTMKTTQIAKVKSRSNEMSFLIQVRFMGLRVSEVKGIQNDKHAHSKTYAPD